MIARLSSETYLSWAFSLLAPTGCNALIGATDLLAREIVERALKIAGEICIYTNQNITIEEI